MFIPGIFCPLSLTLFPPSPFTLDSVTHSSGHSLQQSKIKSAWSFRSFIASGERGSFLVEISFQNLKCTIMACTISWRVVGHDLIAFIYLFFGLVILWEACWAKRKHCFSRFEIWGITRVYRELLPKLCLVYLGEQWMPHPIVVLA